MKNYFSKSIDTGGDQVTPFAVASEELLTKSIKTLTDGTIIADVGGVLSSSKKDTEGDAINQDLLDLSYLQKGFGRIKYEHGQRDRDGNVNDLDEPERFIGVIDNVVRKGGKTEFTGRIIADPKTTQFKLAKAVIDDMQNLQRLNAMGKGEKRVGWSVEGAIIKSQKDKKPRVVVNHVVYTSKPVNTDTVATLLKSLSAGYSYGEGKTGGSALRRESIEKSPIYFQPTQPTGETKMKFHNEEHAYKHFLSKGLPSDKAREEAKKCMMAQDEADNNELTGMNQAEENASKELKKSLEIVSGLLESVDADDPFSTQRRSIAKSLQANSDGEIDAGAFFKATGEITMESAANQIEIAKSMKGIIIALDATVQMNKQLLKKSLENDKQMRELSNENMLLRKSIALADRGVSAAVTGDEKLFDGDGGEKKVKALNKSLAMYGLKQLVNLKKALPIELVNLEADNLSPRTAQRVMDAYNSGEINLPPDFAN